VRGHHQGHGAAKIVNSKQNQEFERALGELVNSSANVQ
jgi:hypothetical protein